MDDWSIRLRRALAQQLTSLGAAGVQQLAVPTAPLDSDENPEAGAQASQAAPGKPEGAVDEAVAADTNPAPSAAPSAPTNSPAESLEQLRAEVAGCHRCEALACARTQTVFGVGPADAKLCFFGEAPGFEEDQAGEPFVGKAGQLLTDIIQKGMGLQRSEVYILNVLKCRPPKNRNPEPAEIDNCRAFYEQQLATIKPQFICCLGAFSARELLNTDLSVGRLRGRMHDYTAAEFSAKVCVTYHPAYLLRRPEEKRKTWDDIQVLMAAMGLEK